MISLKLCTVIAALYTYILIADGQNMRPNAISCIPQQIFTSIQSPIRKLSPMFCPESLKLVFHTDNRKPMGPKDFYLAPLLHNYYYIGRNRLKDGTESLKFPDFQGALIKNFELLYGDLLVNYGLPLSCISYYSGTINSRASENLRHITQQLKFRYNIVPKNFQSSGNILSEISGVDILRRLRIRHSWDYIPKELKSSSDFCNHLLYKLTDGRVLAKLPVLSSPPSSIKIPLYLDALQTDQGNITAVLEQYIIDGLTCLENDAEKFNFLEVIINWLSNKAIPELVNSGTCPIGFPSILFLLSAISDFSNIMTVSKGQKNSPLDRYGNKRSVLDQTPISKQHDWFQNIQPPIQQLNNSMNKRDLSNGEKIHEKLVKEKAEKFLHDVELKILYDKLNDQFLKNNLKIARLDLVKLPDIVESHERNNIKARKQKNLTKKVTKKKTTQKTTTKTTTTTTIEPITEKITPVVPFFIQHKLTKTTKRSRKLKIIGELEVDEEKLKKPLSVLINDKKVKAELNIRPLNYSLPSLIELDKSAKTGFKLRGRKMKINRKVPHHFHWGHHEHALPPGKHLAPVDLRAWILQRHFGSGSKEKNKIDNMLGAVGNSIASFFGVFAPAKDIVKIENETITEEIRTPYYRRQAIDPNIQRIAYALSKKVKNNEMNLFDEGLKNQQPFPVRDKEDKEREQGLADIVKTNEEFSKP